MFFYLSQFLSFFGHAIDDRVDPDFIGNNFS